MKLVLNCKGNNKFSLQLLLLAFSLILGTLLVGCGASSSGDSPPVEPDPPTLDVSVNNIFKDGCPTIRSYITVRDLNGNIINDLGIDDFTITEDDLLLTVETFNPSPSEPFAFAIMMDYSSSLINETIPEVEIQMKAAATLFVDMLADTQKGFDYLTSIVKFAQKVKFVNGYDPENPQNSYGEFTSDINILKSAIDVRPPVYDIQDPNNPGTIIDEGIGTATNLLGSLKLTIENIAALNQNLPENVQPRKLGIILLTDGEENIDPQKIELENVIRQANENSVPIFIMGVTDNVNHYDEPLIRIANETGGIYFELPDLQSIEEKHGVIYDKIVSIIENQYEITYTSSATPSQSLNQLSITVKIGDDFGTGIGSFSACE